MSENTEPQKGPRSPWKAAVSRRQLVVGRMVQGVALVRLKGRSEPVAKLLKDKTGVIRYLTKRGDGRWREQPSRAAFLTMKDAANEVGKWI